MVLSKCLVNVQQDLLKYISDEYIDLSNQKVVGNNKLNEALKEYNISFKFGAGKIDSGASNLCYVLVTSSNGEQHTLGGGSYKDTVTISVIAKQTVNSINSTLSYTIVNSVISEVLREWAENYRGEVVIFGTNFDMKEPEFIFSDNSVGSFNSINSIQYTNTITFQIINYKELDE